MREHYAKLAKERQREHGGTAPGREKDTSVQKSGSDSDRRKSEASEQAGAALNVSRQSVDRARSVDSGALIFQRYRTSCNHVGTQQRRRGGVSFQVTMT